MLFEEKLTPRHSHGNFDERNRSCGKLFIPLIHANRAGQEYFLVDHGISPGRNTKRPVPAQPRRHKAEPPLSPPGRRAPVQLPPGRAGRAPRPRRLAFPPPATAGAPPPPAGPPRHPAPGAGAARPCRPHAGLHAARRVPARPAPPGRSPGPSPGPPPRPPPTPPPPPPPQRRGPARYLPRSRPVSSAFKPAPPACPGPRHSHATRWRHAYITTVVASAARRLGTEQAARRRGMRLLGGGETRRVTTARLRPPRPRAGLRLAAPSAPPTFGGSRVPAGSHGCGSRSRDGAGAASGRTGPGPGPAPLHGRIRPGCRGLTRLVPPGLLCRACRLGEQRGKGQRGSSVRLGPL